MRALLLGAAFAGHQYAQYKGLHAKASSSCRTGSSPHNYSWYVDPKFLNATPYSCRAQRTSHIEFASAVDQYR